MRRLQMSKLNFASPAYVLVILSLREDCEHTNSCHRRFDANVWFLDVSHGQLISCLWSPRAVDILFLVKTKQSSFHAGAPTCLLETVEFVFLPDVPVQCFDVPAAMLCVMGQRTKKTHYRDGMDFRADLLWLPDIADTDMAMVLKSSQIQQPKHMCWSQQRWSMDVISQSGTGLQLPR